MTADSGNRYNFKSILLKLNTRKALLFVAVLGIFPLLNSCSVFDKDEPIPSYLYIHPFELQTNPGTEGQNANDIRDVWLEVNGREVGTFEVPVTVPVLAEGNDLNMILRAGIRNNGRSDNRIAYPFYSVLRDTIQRREGGLDSIFPVIRYVDNAIFPWLEDFEDRTISMEIADNNVTIDSIGITSDSSLVYNYGPQDQYSAIVDLKTGSQYFECNSINTFSFPRGRAIYLEMNYRTDVNLQVGLLALQQNALRAQIPVLLLFPTEGQWKKVYISLAEDVNSSNYKDMDFKVFLSARNDGSQANPRILFDNIKIVHQ